MNTRMNAAGLCLSLLGTGGLVAALGVLAAACVAPQPAEGDLGEVASAVVDSNALTANALTANALTANALTANALTANALTANGLAASVLTAITDPSATGDLTRQFLKYAVSCAFSSTQSLAFSWTDSSQVTHAETYPGQLGLATGWATGPLTTTGQQWVSACLASRTNWYGVPVNLSSRAHYLPLATTSAERLTDYPNIEGAFFGNVFSSTPALYACYDSAHITDSRLWLRDCATGHANSNGTTSNCGMITVLGACSTYCTGAPGTGVSDDMYYSSCYSTAAHKAGTLVPIAITTALPSTVGM